MSDKVGIVDVFDAYKRRLGTYLEQNMLQEAQITALKRRVEELEADRGQPDESGVDSEG